MRHARKYRNISPTCDTPSPVRYQAMDSRRKKALRQYHPDLRTDIIVSHFLPKLHTDAGGFLTDVESAHIKETSGTVEQVDELIDILVKKENKDFDYFCDVLEKEGCQASSSRLKVAGGLGKLRAEFTAVMRANSRPLHAYASARLQAKI